MTFVEGSLCVWAVLTVTGVGPLKTVGLFEGMIRILDGAGLVGCNDVCLVNPSKGPEFCRVITSSVVEDICVGSIVSGSSERIGRFELGIRVANKVEEVGSDMTDVCLDTLGPAVRERALTTGLKIVFPFSEFKSILVCQGMDFKISLTNSTRHGFLR